MLGEIRAKDENFCAIANLMERTDGSAVAEFHQIDSILVLVEGKEGAIVRDTELGNVSGAILERVFHESSLGPDVPDKRCVVSPNRHDSTLRCEVQGRDGTVVFVRKAIFQLARRDIPEKDVAAFIRSHATQAIRRNRNGLYASFVLAIQGAQWGFAQRVQIVDSYPAVIAAGQHQRCGDPWAGTGNSARAGDTSRPLFGNPPWDPRH